MPLGFISLKPKFGIHTQQAKSGNLKQQVYHTAKCLHGYMVACKATNVKVSTDYEQVTDPLYQTTIERRHVVNVRQKLNKIDM
jgi:hypothetical protein